jgi:hypothetical protein
VTLRLGFFWEMIISAFRERDEIVPVPSGRTTGASVRWNYPGGCRNILTMPGRVRYSYKFYMTTGSRPAVGKVGGRIAAVPRGNPGGAVFLVLP